MALTRCPNCGKMQYSKIHGRCRSCNIRDIDLANLAAAKENEKMLNSGDIYANQMTKKGFGFWNKMEADLPPEKYDPDAVDEVAPVPRAKTDSRWALLGTGKRTRPSSTYQKAPSPDINNSLDKLIYKIKHPFKEILYEENCSVCGLPMLPRYRVDNITDKPDWYECANGHRQSILSRLKKYRTTLVSEAPKVIVMLIGLLLFTFEITTFGGGEYATYYLPFVFFGIIIGVSAWWLHYKRIRKEENESEIKSTKETVTGKSESGNAAPGAGISAYAANAANIENKEDNDA